MKRFSFSLGAVLEFRRRQLERVESRLGEVSRRQSGLRDMAASRRRQSLGAVAGLPQTPGLSGAELRATQHWLTRLEDEHRGALAAAQGLEPDRQRCLREMIEMRRKVKLLERLRSRKLGTYLRDLDREKEALAAEFHLARRVRERQG